MKLSGVHLSVYPICATAVACGGFAAESSGQAISIDHCTARLQQARPPFDPYPQQHGSQQQMRAVSCLQQHKNLNTDLLRSLLLLILLKRSYFRDTATKTLLCHLLFCRVTQFINNKFAKKNIQLSSKL